MAAIQILAPSEEPITLAEAKLNQRVEHSVDDSLITGLIVAARRQAEHRTGRQLVSAKWRLLLDAWPENGVIEPPHPPLISVETVKYTDADGVLQTLAGSAYQVDAASRNGRIVPAYGSAWPSARASLNAIQIEYTAGYGAAAAVPEDIKRWMHLALGVWYDNRSALVNGTVTELPAEFAAGLLHDYCIHKF